MPPTAGPAIDTRGLVRRFGAITALDRVDLAVPRGAFFALVGSNGAGKSTTVRILTGLLAPGEGTVRVLGENPRKAGAVLRQRIGVVPDFPVLYDVLSPRENIVRLSALRGLTREEAERRLEELAVALALDEHLDQSVRSLSQGTRKKAALAAALIHGPSLLFLDEPFEGIDPVAARGIRNMLEALRQRGVTIFLTSHVLPLVESLATHVAVIDEGRVLTSGPLTEVVGRHDTLERAILEALGVPPDVPTMEWYLP